MSKRNIGLYRYLIAITLGLGCVLIAASTSANDDSQFIPVTLKYVIDGDTFRGFVNGDIDDVPIRLRDVDTPERRGKCQQEKDMALEATDYLKKLLKTGVIELSNVGEDKYGRVLADVYVDKQSVSKLIIENGYGRQWSGRRESWCN
ncbi:hypothetical protein TUM3794_21050 [Shewanella colwelliana]|uniref:TNase-like domain-containing protein n=1 Tax=Shewanella colwelliana TaxID=23 RepID=A0ABQ4P0Z5_SHECO|nr:thermonuclease family protein [Shewanella colwelliana]GIU41147.1 hypothetical protein TUM3794_21050 [Shewanella colwelliana]